jgi:hypothetical protein
MSRKATDWAWDQQIKPATLKLILLSMADRADEYHTCYPSIQRLEKDTGLNNKTIQTGLKKLESLNIIVDTGERKGPTRRVRVFKISCDLPSKNTDVNHPKIGNIPVIGNIPNNGALNDPKIGVLNDPEIGVQNQSLEPVIESKDIYVSFTPKNIKYLFIKTSGLKKIIKVGESRKKAIKARSKDLKTLADWTAFFKRVSESPFLTGKVGDFEADFDWILKESNFIKIQEGKYDTRISHQQGEQSNLDTNISDDFNTEWKS